MIPDIFKEQPFNTVYFRDKKYSRQQLQNGVSQFSGYLLDSLPRNSPFIFLLPRNHVKMLYAYFGIIKAGYIPVLLHPDTTQHEMEEISKITDPQGIVAIDAEGLNFNYEKEVVCRSGAKKPKKPEILEDVYTIVYSSAEDGYSKPVMLTKDNILWNVKSGAECEALRSCSISCALLPYHHTYGLITGILTPLMSGSKILIEEMGSLYGIEKMLKKFHEMKVTNIYSVPMLYKLMSKIKNARELLSSTERMVSAGIKLPEEIFNEIKKKVGKELLMAYGFTEATLICTYYPPGEKSVLNSSGKPVSCCEVNILSQDGTKAPLGAVGEIGIRGKSVMKGYYCNEKATSRVMKSGWLASGDMGYLNEAGYLFVTGVRKRMLNVMGENVYPAEVERYFSQNDNVSSVSVFGTPEDDYCLTVCAKILLKKNTEDEQSRLRSWAKKRLSKYKMPKKFIFEGVQ